MVSINKQDEIGCILTEDKGMNCTPANEKINYGWVPIIYICDSYSDCKHGEDEIHCGYDFGLTCNMSINDSKQFTGWVDR